MADEDLDKHVRGDDNTRGDNEIFTSGDESYTNEGGRVSVTMVWLAAIAAAAVVTGITATRHYRHTN